MTSEGGINFQGNSVGLVFFFEINGSILIFTFDWHPGIGSSS